MGGYEVFPSAPQFRKGNSLSFSVGPACVFYVKLKVDPYTFRCKAGEDGGLEEAGVHYNQKSKP